MVAVVFFIGGVMKLTSNITTNMSTYSVSSPEDITDQIESMLSESENNVAILTESLQTITDETEIAEMQFNIAVANLEVDYYNMALENNIDILYGTDYMVNSLTMIMNGEMYQLYVDYGYYTATQEELVYLDETLSGYKEVIENKDYSLYIDLQKDAIAQDTTLSEKDKEIYNNAFELLLEANPDGQAATNLETQIQSLITAQQSYESGTSSTGAVLSNDEKEELEDNIKIMEYEIENQIGTGEDSLIAGSAIMSMISTGVSIITILVIILAGGAISSELSSGTIKSLIISPTKRWKIFTAKFLSITTVGIFASLVSLIVALISFLIFFGTGDMDPYVFAVGGKVHSIPFLIYMLIYTLLCFIDVFVFMSFAFMLSIITKNTAASVGVALGTYFAGGFTFGIISSLFYSKWMNFVPFTNMGIADRIFTNSSVMEYANQAGAGSVLSNTPSVLFSSIYFVVLVVCMLWIGFDSFTRKDI